MMLSAHETHKTDEKANRNERPVKFLCPDDSIRADALKWETVLTEGSEGNEGDAFNPTA
jgi:hypothetical protein